MFTEKRLLFVCVLTTLLAFASDVLLSAQPQDTNDSKDVFDMSIEELMNVEIVSSATLTKTKPRLVPAAVTTVTDEQIRASGARSLFELLDIYVPNLQWIRHHWEADHMGLRGIYGESKYLLLVNGRVMNERTHYGAMSERDLVLLGDIHHIDIVRGPGSALYGPGAISMVINIITYNADTFKGTEVTTRMGAVEEFYAGEFKHGRKFDSNDGGFFLYGGIGKYLGANQDDAPQIFAYDFPDAAGQAAGTRAGDPLRHPGINRDGETHRNLPPVKLHAQVTKGNWDMWARYTRGGKQGVWDIQNLTSNVYGWGFSDLSLPNTYGYQQATAYIGYKQELAENLGIDYAFSYNMQDFERFIEHRMRDAYREDEYYGKILLQWQPSDKHKIAVGSEISHKELGIKSPGWPTQRDYARSSIWSPTSWIVINPMPRWATNLYSLFGEHQWTINDKWTTFIGARFDRHTYTSWMFSPRLAVVHTPTDKDTFKLMWSRSVRANMEEELKANALAGGGDSDPEKLDSIELRYERQQNKNLDLAASVFVHYNFELIGWNQVGSAGNTTNIGTQRDYGFELEASYHTERTRLVASHGYTKLYDFFLTRGVNTNITADPYGIGDDLADWSNHISKLTFQRKLNDKWTFDSSLRVYWGFPGMKDWGRHSDSAVAGFPVIKDGWQRGYRGNYYLNLGLQYKPSKNLTIGITGYNLLGIINKDLNKRNYTGSYGDYRCQAPALGVSLTYKF